MDSESSIWKGEEAVELMCMHNQPLYVVEYDGVYHYQHADKTSCELLNSYIASVDDILLEIGKQEVKETPRLRAAYSCSLSLRLQYYKTMAKASKEAEKTDADMLEKFIKRVTFLISGVWNEATLTWELHEVFGDVVFENIFKVCKTQFPKRERPKPSYKLPRYKMVNLENAARDRGYLDLSHRIEKQSAFSTRKQRGFGV